MFKTMIGGIVQKHLKNKVLKSTVKEEDIEGVLKEIRIALLDADVNIIVVKDLIKSIRQEIVGQIVPENVKLSDYFLNVVKSKLSEVLGKEFKEFNYDKPNMKIMMVGLQGSGKTTTCANGLSPAEPRIFTIEDELPFVPSEICTLVAVCKISCKVVFPDFAISAEVMIVTLPFDFISSVCVISTLALVPPVVPPEIPPVHPAVL
jgi:hypothetical protein